MLPFKLLVVNRNVKFESSPDLALPSYMRYRESIQVKIKTY
jgi:hypothetical protein